MRTKSDNTVPITICVAAAVMAFAVYTTFTRPRPEPVETDLTNCVVVGPVIDIDAPAGAPTRYLFNCPDGRRVID